MPVKFRVYVVRHGETDWNRTRKLQGHSDVSLNELGLNQSMLVGEALKDVLFVRAFSSDLKRAVKVRTYPDPHRTVSKVIPDRRVYSPIPP